MTRVCAALTSTTVFITTTAIVRKYICMFVGVLDDSQVHV